MTIKSVAAPLARVSTSSCGGRPYLRLAMALLATAAICMPGVAGSVAITDVAGQAAVVPADEAAARKLSAEGKYAEAEPVYRALLAERERTLGAGAKETLITVSELGLLYTRLKRFNEAEPLLKRSLAGLENLLGTDHRETLITANDLAFLYQQSGRLAEAEPLFVRALEGFERTSGPLNPDTLVAMSSLGSLYLEQKRYEDAKPLLQRALAGQQKLLKPGSSDLMLTFGRVAKLVAEEERAEASMRPSMAAVAETKTTATAPKPTAAECDAMAPTEPRCVSVWSYARLSESGPAAEADFRKAIALGEKLAAAGERNAVALDSAYWALFSMLQRKARFREAEPVARARAEAASAGFGPNSDWHMEALGELGANLNRQGKVVEAEKVLRRALALEVPTSSGVVDKQIKLSDHLGTSLRAQGRLTEAQDVLFGAARLIYRQLKGHGMTTPDLDAFPAWYATRKDDRAVHSTLNMARDLLNNLGMALSQSGKKSEALEMFQEAVKFGEPLPFPFQMVGVWNNIGMTYSDLKRPAEAIAPMEKAARVAREALGARHPDTIAIEGSLAFIQLHELGQPKNALPHYERASAGLIEELRSSISSAEAEARLKNADLLFRHMVEARWKGEAGGSSGPAAKGGAAFETAQWALSGEAAAALTQVAARFASGKGQLGDLEQRRQTLNAERSAAEQEYYAAQSVFASGDAASTASRKLVELDREIATVTARISALDPAYDDLIRPSALSLAETQRLLDPDEALLLFLANPDAAYTFAVTRNQLQWVRNEALGAAALREKVARLRSQIAVEEARGLERADAPGHFDRALAFELYEGLIQPVAALLADKKTLLTVRDGPLGMLPLHLLVTEKPAGDNGDPAALASTKWLIDSHAVAALPAVSSLKALRCLLVDPSKRHAGCPGSAAGRAAGAVSDTLLLAGIGAPTLRGAPATSRSAPPSIETAFKAGLADTELLRNLAYLPGSQLELEALKAQFGSGVFIRTGDEATERLVKSSGDLGRARFVVFSTHGLVSSETGLTGEPGLVFTPPPFAQRSEEDDGLLTASEAAKLKLSAEFVVLSACNTAAPSGGDGGEGLTGLARSFFFAGARSLLASHWPVSDSATSGLIVGTFKRLQATPGESRPAAFRQAILDLRRDKRWMSPVYWAPFEFVGAD